MKKTLTLLLFLLWANMNALFTQTSTKEALKGAFTQNAVPDEDDFSRLIEACFNQGDGRTIRWDSIQMVFKLSDDVLQRIQDNRDNYPALLAIINSIQEHLQRDSLYYGERLLQIDNAVDKNFEAIAENRDSITALKRTASHSQLDIGTLEDRVNENSFEISTHATALNTMEALTIPDVYATMDEQHLKVMTALEDTARGLRPLIEANQVHAGRNSSDIAVNKESIAELDSSLIASGNHLTTLINERTPEIFTDALKNKLAGIEPFANKSVAASYDTLGLIKLSTQFTKDYNNRLQLVYGGNFVSLYAADTTASALWVEVPAEAHQWMRIKEFKFNQAGQKTDSILHPPYKFRYKSLEEHLAEVMSVDSREVVWGYFNAQERGDYNVLIGNKAGYGLNNAGTQNVMVGHEAGYHTGSTQNSVLVGYRAGYNNSGNGNVAIGKGAASGANTQNSIVIGTNAGLSSQAEKSIIIGHSAALQNKGKDNIIIGNASALQGNSNTQNNIVVGHDIDVQDKHGVIAIGEGLTADKDEQLLIGDFIQGDMAAQSLQIEGDLSVKGALEAGSTDIAALDAETVTATYITALETLKAKYIKDVENITATYTIQARTLKATQNISAVGTISGKTVNATTIGNKAYSQLRGQYAHLTHNSSGRSLQASGEVEAGSFKTKGKAKLGSVESSYINLPVSSTTTAINTSGKIVSGSVETATATVTGTLNIGSLSTSGDMKIMGRLGIGLDPSEKLDVDGAIKARTLKGRYGTNSTGMVHDHNNGNVTFNALGGNAYLGYSGAKGVSIYTGSGVGAGTEKMKITQDGKVGIGTSPNSKLHLNSTATGETPLRMQIDGNSKLTLASNGGLSVGAGNDSPPADGLYVSGNVAIGKTAAGEKVDVNGKVKATGFIGNGTIPIGGIIMWSGAKVPEGWALCDGRTYNGVKTPNLRGRFVVGYNGTGDGGTAITRNLGADGKLLGVTSDGYDMVGKMYGEDKVTLTGSEVPLRDHRHSSGTLYTSSAGSHRHNYHGYRAVKDKGGQHVKSREHLPGDPLDYGGDSAGAHQHNIGGNTGYTVINGANPHENRPPYYVIAFIMRVK